MRKFCFSLLFLTFVTATITDVLLAQYGEEYCVIVLTGQNRNRTVAGAVNTECEGIHSKPFGNWGVASNYGRIRDKDQFRGWWPRHTTSTKKQWNSCTTKKAKYRAPNCTYYRRSVPPTPPYRCDKQYSNDVVTHGTLRYRTAVQPCPPPWWPAGSSSSGCRWVGTVGQASNHMSLYELDPGGGNQLVETLYFPGTSVTLTGCTKEECPEKTTGWVRMTSSTSSTAKVEAELRMKARAYFQACDWSWTEGGGSGN